MRSYRRQGHYALTGELELAGLLVATWIGDNSLCPVCTAVLTTPAPFDGSTVEKVCKKLANAVTGSQIPNLIQPLNYPDDVDRATKWKRLFDAVAHAQNRQQDGRPLLRLVTEVMRLVRFDSPAAHEAIRGALNARLLLTGYMVGEEGQITGVKSARTVSEAQRRATDLRTELQRREVQEDILNLPGRAAGRELLPRGPGGSQERR